MNASAVYLSSFSLFRVRSLMNRRSGRRAQTPSRRVKRHLFRTRKQARTQRRKRRITRENIRLVLALASTPYLNVIPRSNPLASGGLTTTVIWSHSAGSFSTSTSGSFCMYYREKRRPTVRINFQKKVFPSGGGATGRRLLLWLRDTESASFWIGNSANGLQRKFCY